MKTVRISELKSHLSEHLRRAEAGEVIEVLDRARPIARLGPAGASVDLLEILPAERPFSAVRTVRLRRISGALDSTAALALERGTR
jgi:prevent-host-death family protein